MSEKSHEDEAQSLFDAIQSLKDCMGEEAFSRNNLDISHSDVVDLVKYLHDSEYELEMKPLSHIQPYEPFSEIETDDLLRLTQKDVGSIFKDGGDVHWKIVGFNPSEEYGVAASLTNPFLSFLYEEFDLGEFPEYFDQFGRRKGFKLDSPYSLKSIA